MLASSSQAISSVDADTHTHMYTFAACPTLHHHNNSRTTSTLTLTFVHKKTQHNSNCTLFSCTHAALAGFSLTLKGESFLRESRFHSRQDRKHLIVVVVVMSERREREEIGMQC